LGIDPSVRQKKQRLRKMSDEKIQATKACTNNIAEYEAVILGLRKQRALGVTTYIIRTDSKVVAGQVKKDYAAKDLALMQYLAAIRSLERQFKGFTLQHVDRAKNEEADALAKAAAKCWNLLSRAR
jgi:ribonuclease HI